MLISCSISVCLFELAPFTLLINVRFYSFPLIPPEDDNIIFLFAEHQITFTAIKKKKAQGWGDWREDRGGISPLSCYKCNKDERLGLNPFSALSVVTGLSHARSHC